MLPVIAEAAETTSYLAAPPIVYGLVALGVQLFGLMVTLAFKSVGTRH